MDPDQFQNAIRQSPGPIEHIIVLAETASTQDAARQRATAGTAVIAARQTSGRGRHGRVWADTGNEGVALTVILSRPSRSSGSETVHITQRSQDAALSATIAVAVCRAVERLGNMLSLPARIKWPNDILVNDRKLAGILIEQSNDRSFIGIGLNVSQTTWPDDLVQSAISLRQAGVPHDRTAVIVSLLQELNRTLNDDPKAVLDEYRHRDALTGRTVTVAINIPSRAPEQVTGRVIKVDPARGIELETATGPRTLDGATCHIVSME